MRWNILGIVKPVGLAPMTIQVRNKTLVSSPIVLLRWRGVIIWPCGRDHFALPPGGDWLAGWWLTLPCLWQLLADWWWVVTSVLWPGQPRPGPTIRSKIALSIPFSPGWLSGSHYQDTARRRKIFHKHWKYLNQNLLVSVYVPPQTSHKMSDTKFPKVCLTNILYYI